MENTARTFTSRILVADDLARENKAIPPAVLELAADLAAAWDAEIHLVHAYHVPELAVPVPSLVALEGPYVDEMRKALEEESRAVQARRPELKIVPEVAKGDTVEVLVKDAEKPGMELAVLNTHARHGVKRALLGSVAEKFISRSPVPVLTINPHTEIVGGFRPKKILLAVDFSEDTRAHVAAAARFARLFGAELHLSHVLEEWVYPLVQSASLLAGGVFLPLERELKEQGNLRYSQLVELARDPSLSGLNVTHSVVERSSSVGEGLMTAANQVKADLIILGSPNRPVIRDAACPVLTLVS